MERREENQEKSVARSQKRVWLQKGRNELYWLLLMGWIRWELGLHPWK